MTERVGYKRRREPIKYERLVEVLELFFDFHSYGFYRTPEEVWNRNKGDFDIKKPLPNITFPINIYYMKFLGLFF